MEHNPISDNRLVSVGLFLLSVLRYLLGDDSAWMFCVPYRCTSMLEIIPEDDEEGYDGENTKKY